MTGLFYLICSSNGRKQDFHSCDMGSIHIQITLVFWCNGIKKLPGGVTGNTSDFDSDILSSTLSLLANMLPLA
jgi:hypothetical protein